MPIANVRALNPKNLFDRKHAAKLLKKEPSVEKRVTQIQMERRTATPGARVSMGVAAAGFGALSAASAATAVFLPPTLPAMAPVSAFAGGLCGMSAAVAAGAHLATPRPRSVRKHLFNKAGIVENRHDSSQLVSALQKAGVLEKGRNRRVNANLDDPNTIRSISDAVALLKVGDVRDDVVKALRQVQTLKDRPVPGSEV